MTAIARLGRKFVIRLVRPAGWARMCLLSPPYAVLTAALLFLPVRQWWIYRLASAMFRPTLARALRAFDDAVVLWAPGRIERDANVESQQPQRQFGGQINHRTPGDAVVQPEALGPSPGGETACATRPAPDRLAPRSNTPGGSIAWRNADERNSSQRQTIPLSAHIRVEETPPARGRHACSVNMRDNAPYPSIGQNPVGKGHDRRSVAPALRAGSRGRYVCSFDAATRPIGLGRLSACSPPRARRGGCFSGARLVLVVAVREGGREHEARHDLPFSPEIAYLFAPWRRL